MNLKIGTITIGKKTPRIIWNPATIPGVVRLPPEVKYTILLLQNNAKLNVNGAGITSKVNNQYIVLLFFQIANT